MDEAVALVIAPFRDIVDKGKTALDNAGDNEDMRKAAQTLVREGERALTRIEPLCKKQFDEYSSNFILALKEEGERSLLTYLRPPPTFHFASFFFHGLH
jgi:hypothetical protein